MARIAIPQSVMDRANEIAGSGRGQGQRQMEVLREYTKAFVPQGHEVDSYERDKTGLFAVTKAVKADPADIPDKFKTKPRR